METRSRTEKKHRPVTINDIAQRSGVSKVTVSYVLNGRETGIRISDATRERVLGVARELGYSPNALARGLARRRTDTITLVMQSPAIFGGWSGFTNTMMRGVVEKANELGYDLMLHTKSLPDIERDVLALADGRADGALLLRDRDDPLAQRLTERGFPCVSFFSRPLFADAWFVDCDNVLGGRIATEHLLDLGHTRIAHIGGSAHSSAAADRRDGYEQALRERGIEPDPEWFTMLTYAGADFGPFLEKMRRSDAPTAVFVWSDDVAIRAIHLLREELGRRIPEEVAVIGFDGTEIGEHTQPRLSSVAQPIYEMAERGVEMLIARIADKPAAGTQVLMSPSLLCRESCSTPRSAIS
jgi:DNA-binding LacI/PurR family transcriptional regulator